MHAKWGRWICLLLLYSITIGQAQNPHPNFRNFTTEHGLPSPEVHEIFQDKTGYIWFGTDSGVSRYDGYEFKSFSAESGLASPVVLKILQDKKGRLWFGTLTGEAFIFDNDRIAPYEYNSVLSEYRFRFSDALLGDVSDGTAYFILQGAGLLVIDSLGNHSLKEFAKDTRLGVWELANSTQLALNYTKGENVQEYYIVYENARGEEFKIKSSKQLHWNLAAKTEDGSTFIFGSDTGYKITPPKNIVTQFDFAHSVSALKEWQGDLWLSHFSKPYGLKKYDAEFPASTYPSLTYLEAHPVTDFTFLNTGELWISSLDQGVFYSSNADTKVYSQKSGLPANAVTSVSFVDSSNLVVGFATGQICLVNTDNNSVRDLKKPIRRNREEYVYDVAYAAMHDQILSGEWYYKGDEWHNWGANYLAKKIEISPDGRRAYGSTARGFSVLDLGRQELQFSSTSVIPRFRNYAVKEIEDQLWIGNNYGIFKFNGDTLEHPGINHPAFHSRVEDIDALPQGGIVFGTKGHGVVIWTQDTFHQVTKALGLPSDMIEDVHVGEKGKIWVATLNGLGEIDFESDTIAKISAFSMDHGLPSNEIYQIRSYGHQPWLCTKGGLVKWVSPSESKETTKPFFTDITVNGKKVVSDELTLSHSQNDLTFNYIALNFKQSGKIPYRYQIQSDATWTHTQNRSINFSNLAPGAYDFAVQAQNEDGYWSESCLMAIKIKPAWYLSKGAIATWFLLFGLAGYLLYKSRVLALKRKDKIAKEILALQQSALQAQMNPHFIFNCLNSIQSLINQDDKERANLYMAKFAKLARECLIASTSQTVPLSQDVSLLTNYLDLEKLRYKDSFSYDLEMDQEIETDLCEVAPMLVQPFVENAIIHGFKSLGDETGHIAISYKMKDHNSIEVTICDNGVGYSIGKLRSNNGPDHKSLGTSITKRRLQILGSGNDTDVAIGDLKNVNGEVSGTEVRLRIHVD